MRIAGVSWADWGRRFLKLGAMIYRRMLFRTRFIAVTGSVGKTTAKELAAAILSPEGPTVFTRRTDNSAMHTVRNILRARPWHRHVVLEIGTNSPGWVARSASLAAPDIGVVLSVARTHTNRFPTLDDTAREKAALLTHVRRPGTAILNQDDPRVAAMARDFRGKVVWIGRGEGADVRAAEITSRWPGRLSLSLIASGQNRRVETQLVGEHWTTSLLAAVAVALECGVSLDRIIDRLEHVRPTPGRLDPQVVHPGATILRDDYNGSLDTFQAASKVLREAVAARKILVITTVSDSQEGWDKRLRRIAREAAGMADVVVLVGAWDNTRKAGKAAAAAGFPLENLHCLKSLPEATQFLRGFLRPGDLCLLRGRTTDHVGRIYHALTHEVRCWIDYCPKMMLCQDCPDLFGRETARPFQGPPPLVHVQAGS